MARARGAAVSGGGWEKAHVFLLLVLQWLSECPLGVAGERARRHVVS